MLKYYKIVMIITILSILTSCNNSSIPVSNNQIIELEEKIEEQSKENELLQGKNVSLQQENKKLEDEVKLLKNELNNIEEDKPKENSINPELQILAVYNNNNKNIIRYIFEEHDGAHQITNIIGYETDGLVGSNEFMDINIDGAGSNDHIYKIKVIGSLYNFELVEVKMDEESNFYENRVIYSVDEVKNKNIYINTVIPEGVPIEKIKWTDKDGKIHECYLGYDGFGFSGEILWSNSAVQINTSEDNYLEGNEDKKIEINPVDIDLSRTNGYTLIDKCNWNIDADSTIESIELYIDAEKSEDGEFMFDDEHKWLLLVRDDSQEYILFDKSIHIGELEVNVYQVYNENSYDTHITTILKTTAGLDVKEYIKEESRDIFTEEVIMERTGINYIKNLSVKFY